MLVVGIATVTLKGAGPVLAAVASCRGERRRNGAAGAALLAALVATKAFASEEALVLDKRGAGRAAAGVAVALKAPLLMVIVVAAVTAGLPQGDRMTARGWILLAAVSVVWGVPYLFIKLAVDDGLSPGFVAWSRVALAALVLLPIALRKGPCAACRCAGWPRSRCSRSRSRSR